MSDEIKNVEATEESFEEMLEKSFKTLNTGEKVTGIVTAIGPTEVQVDLGCKQAGYIAIDELSADPNVKPEDVVKVGDEIETYIPLAANLCQVLGVGTLTISDHDHNVHPPGDIRRLGLTFLRSITYCIKYFGVCTLFF